ncbi:MAG: hypothetical protein H7246_06925 [Phycisphaerae bacterium]|nr:hypothetical protein [Saprospiraceae bacterium]
MEFVINEWFLEWHKPDAISEEQRKARVFTSWLLKREYRIVVLRNCDFTQKLNDIRRKFGYHPMGGIQLKIFFSQIFMNVERCRIVDIPPELPPEIEAILKRPPENPLKNIESDRYLFESAETTEEKIIVTTDTKLMAHFEGNGRYQLWGVEEFIIRFKIE